MPAAVVSALMALAPGTRLGPYEVIAPLGAGGMGEVYRGRDTRLDRAVAIKVLPPHLAANVEARQRFEVEARAISSLSHPHVCALYDLGHEQGVEFLVMELLDGETLAARLQRGALPCDQALVFAGQIAAALERAHRQGIVHRDLKPANVMLTKSGVKLLDFGLARLLPPGPSAVGLSTGPTRAQGLTAEGTLLGTLQYMSPEQLEGKAVDARTDIFALGAVLYEMVTGSQAFSGANPASIISAILRDHPPPVSARLPLAPAALDRLIAHCLAKDPDERWQTAHDLRLQLAELRAVDPAASATASATGSAVPTRRPGRSLRLAAGLAATLLTGLLIGLVIDRSTTFTTVAQSRAPLRFQLAPPSQMRFRWTVETQSMAFAPDGKSLAFVAVDEGGTPSLWLRPLADASAHLLPGTEGATSLFWSPDSREIGFFAKGGLSRVGFGGAAPVKICDVPVTGSGLSGSWGRDAIAFSSVMGDAIRRVAVGGGVSEVIVEPDEKASGVRVVWPWFLPDGQTLLYSEMHADGQPHLMLFTADGQRRELAPVSSRVEYVDPGFLLYARDNVLYAQAFDASRGELAGAPFSLAPAIQSFRSTMSAAFATSRSGNLVWAAQGDRNHLAWFDRKGRWLGDLGQAGQNLDVTIAGDGRRGTVARLLSDLGTYDLWLLDLENGSESRLTTDPRTEITGYLLPDGKRLVHSASRGGAPHLVLRDLASGAEHDLTPGKTFQTTQGVSRDGSWLVFSERNSLGNFGLWRLDLDGSQPPQAVSTHPELDYPAARLSPDGSLLAVMNKQSGRAEVYVRALTGSGKEVQVSTEGAGWLGGWSADGRELFFTSRDQRLFAARVSSDPVLAVSPPEVLFTLPGLGWGGFAVHPDGRFLAVMQDVDARSAPLEVAVNWPAAVPGAGSQPALAP